jgi:hypothetical protein
MASISTVNFGRSSMSKGNFRETPFANILIDTSNSSGTVTLTATDGKSNRTVYFMNGIPVFASSTWATCWLRKKRSRASNRRTP